MRHSWWKNGQIKTDVLHTKKYDSTLAKNASLEATKRQKRNGDSCTSAVALIKMRHLCKYVFYLHICAYYQAISTRASLTKDR